MILASRLLGGPDHCLRAAGWHALVPRRISRARCWSAKERNANYVVIFQTPCIYTDTRIQGKRLRRLAALDIAESLATLKTNRALLIAQPGVLEPAH